MTDCLPDIDPCEDCDENPFECGFDPWECVAARLEEIREGMREMYE
jgi:hypothetical protein